MADYCGPECYAPGGHHGPAEGTAEANAYYDNQIKQIEKKIQELESMKARIQGKKT